MKTINLTEEEYAILCELVEDSLGESSPTVTPSLQTLAIKLQLEPHTMRWINRMLVKEETKDEKS